MPGALSLCERRNIWCLKRFRTLQTILLGAKSLSTELKLRAAKPQNELLEACNFTDEHFLIWGSKVVKNFVPMRKNIFTFCKLTANHKTPVTVGNGRPHFYSLESTLVLLQTSEVPLCTCTPTEKDFFARFGISGSPPERVACIRTTDPGDKRPEVQQYTRVFSTLATCN